MKNKTVSTGGTNNDLSEVKIELNRISDIIEMLTKFEQNRSDASKHQIQQIEIAISKVGSFEKRLGDFENNQANDSKDQDRLRQAVEDLDKTLTTLKTTSISEIRSEVAVVNTKCEMLEKQIQQLSTEINAKEERKLTKKNLIIGSVIALLVGLFQMAPSIVDFFKKQPVVSEK